MADRENDALSDLANVVQMWSKKNVSRSCKFLQPTNDKDTTRLIVNKQVRNTQKAEI